MANWRFSRGAGFIADASLSFIVNIDVSVQQVVNSNKHNLFQPMPSEFLTRNFVFIIIKNYLA